jgi:hypothetical protein
MITFQFLLTALVVVLAPGTGVIYTLALGLGQGPRAAIWAARSRSSHTLPPRHLGLPQSSTPAHFCSPRLKLRAFVTCFIWHGRALNQTVRCP